jgi:large subunit ribosomal protein L9
MKVILMQELQGKGGEGDVIDVAHGYAVNYLLPRGIAIEATKGNLKQLEQRRHNIEKREIARTTDAGKLQEVLDGTTINIPARVGEEGQLFGSITAAQISDAIAEQVGPTIDRKKVEVRRPIKEVGVTQVAIGIYRDIKATINVNVYDENGSPEDAAAADEESAGEAESEQAAAEEAPAEDTAAEPAVEIPPEKAAEI